MAHPDLEQLLSQSLDMAKTLLAKNKEFFPFGFRKSQENAVHLVSAFDESEHPTSEDVISALRNIFCQEAQSKKL